MKGKNSLLPLEINEMGDVKNKTLLHSQCHFGLDTLSWARMGADVTGIDFSEKAVETAKSLSQKTGINAEFIQADIYNIPQLLKRQYDIVFTSYGVLCWLPDIKKWAKIISSCLKPKGVFYMTELHPY